MNSQDLLPEHQAQQIPVEDEPVLGPKELSEATLAAFQLPPASWKGSAEARRKLHHSIASRTIAAAAAGGRLRSLQFRNARILEPFLVSRLIPFWVGIEDWALER